MKDQKINKRLQVLVTEDQHEKLRTISYYTGKSLGVIIREAIDQMITRQRKEDHEQTAENSL